MSIDAAGYRYCDGPPGVVAGQRPARHDPPGRQAYGIQWLVLERDDGVSAVGPVLDGDRPEWLEPPIVITRGKAGGSTVDAGIYRVRQAASGVAR